MDSILRETLKAEVGITDEDLEKLSPQAQQGLTQLIKTRPFKVVAEVTDARYCMAQLKVGQKLVFDGAGLNFQESTAPPCIRALGPLMEAVNAVTFGGLEGKVPENIVAAHAECLDPGLENGGMGKVKFKVWWHRVGPGERE